MSQITFEDIKKNKIISAMVEQSNRYLEAVGYTDHGPRHVGYVSRITADILKKLGYSQRIVELGAIAGWVHDIGNLANRKNHGITGANLLMPVLLDMGMNPEEVLMLCTAVANHEEEIGAPVNEVCAALIIADKVDAHRARVRRNKYNFFDIHDRVNYSIKKTSVVTDPVERVIRFSFTMDESSSIKEFFEIYMSRMTLSEKAAAYLNCRFEIIINGVLINPVPKMPKAKPEPPESNGV